MCIIIDVNKIHNVVSGAVSVEFEPIRRWLERGEGQVIFGDSLVREMVNEKGRSWLLAQFRAGRAIRVNSDKLKSEVDVIEREGVHQSDDPHILGIARVSGARILYSDDNKLIQDFKSPEILNNPRGKVYKHQGAESVLTRDACRGCGAS